MKLAPNYYTVMLLYYVITRLRYYTRGRASWLKLAPHYHTAKLLYYVFTLLRYYTRGRASWLKLALIKHGHFPVKPGIKHGRVRIKQGPPRSWFQQAPNFHEGIAPWPTTAYLEARRAPAQPEAQP